MGNYEDARVRMYRIIEMIGQIYLFDKGYDTACINPNDERVKKFIALPDNNLIVKNGICSFHRTNTCSFIKKYFDPQIGQLLFDIMDTESKNCIMGYEERNISILIHGFSIKNPKDINMLKDGFDKTEKVLKSILSISQNDIDLAQKMNSFKF